MTTNYSAEYGRTSGAVINAVLKEGSNGFHGDAYWFLRDEGLDAKNFFDTASAIPPFHRNQFGASAGGPIIKNKTFFFADYEGVRQTRSGTATDFVPSSNARNGILCSTAAASCGGAQILVKNLPASINDTAANGGNGTNANGIDNVTAKYLPLYPQPNPSLGTDSTGNIGEVVTNPLQIYTENYVTARVDHKFSEKDNLDGFYFHDRSPQVTPDNFLLSTTDTVSSRQMVGLEETHIFSPSLVNTFHAGYNRSVGLVGLPGTALQTIAADTTLGVGTGRYTPIIQINGANIGLMQGGLGSQARYNHKMNSFQYNDDVFLTRGLHSIKFGGSVERLQGNEFTIQRPNGSFVFNSLQDFLTNMPAQLNSIGSTAVGKSYGERITFIGGYVQDDWHIRPNLTLNLGLRYEMATLPTEIHNDFSVIENVFGGPRVSVVHPWQTNATLRNFAPRVGFAWDPFHSGKTSVRGGFGIFDILPGTWIGLNQETGSYPFALTLSSTGQLPAYSFATPAANLIGANQTAANLTAATIANAQAWAPDQHPKRNYSMNWNFNVQRQITSTLTATVGYVGMHTVHSPFTTDQSNMTLPIPGTNFWPCGPNGTVGVTCASGFLPTGTTAAPIKNTVIDPNVGALRPTFWMVSSHYNGVQAQLTERMSHGLQASGSFTYGKCMDDTSSGLIGDPFQNSFTTTMFFLRASRVGRCDFNISDNFVVNFIWNVPGPKSGLMSYIAGGWQTGAILTASTGIPTTPFIGGDPLGLINQDAVVYPDYVRGCDPVNHKWKSEGAKGSYFNAACYTVPIAPASIASDPTKCAPYTAAGTPANSCMQLFGNAGRNSVVGPSSFDLDFSLFKNYAVHRISESFNVQFRAEFFNVLNHPNFLLPNFNEGNNQIFSPTGAPINAVIDSTGTYDPRQIQFGLKVIW